MSFDGNIVKHLLQEWNETLLSGRINKIYQISRFDLLFIINTKNGKSQLLVSSSPSYARCYISTMNFEKPQNPPTFCMFLRKQLEGGIIQNIQQIEHDRVIVFDIEKRNELGDLANKKLILEMMGRYSNIIVTDDNDRILEAIKHSMPFDDAERTLFPGAIYTPPKIDKINPLDTDKLHQFLEDPDHITTQSLLQNIMGFSPLIIHEIIHQYTNLKRPIKDIFKDVLTTKNPTQITGDKDNFYSLDLTHIDGDRKTYPTINELLDRYYFERDKIDIIKQYAKDITIFVKNYINRLQHKLNKLADDMKKTKTMDDYRLKGELIQANLQVIQKGDTVLDCINYYNNERIKIPLNPKLSPIKNSEKYFKKYKKLKTSIPYINKQIRSAKNELEYFYEIEAQFEYATLKDMEEIKQELVELRYMKGSSKKQKRKSKPNMDTYTDSLGIAIVVGKNNIQNQFITHQLAKHNDVWFHVKGAPGSHVVVRNPFPLEEETIRTAALLAAYYSKMRNSSSVPVDYTEVRNIKKIPGKASNFVTYKQQKTIYIDPTEDAVLALKKT